MSKYDALWKAIGTHEENNFMLTFREAEALAGVPMDHSFLTEKKNLPAYGYEVGKISMKNRTITFLKKGAEE